MEIFRNYSARKRSASIFNILVFSDFSDSFERWWPSSRRNEARDFARAGERWTSSGATRRRHENCFPSAERGGVRFLRPPYRLFILMRPLSIGRTAQLSSALGEEGDGIERSWTHRSRSAHVVNRHPRKSVFRIRKWFPSFPQHHGLIGDPDISIYVAVTATMHSEPASRQKYEI